MNPHRQAPDRGRRRALSRTLLARRALAVAVAVAAAWAVRGQEGEGGRAGRIAVEDAYLETLITWARGSSSAMEEFSGLQQRLVDREAGFEVTPASLSRYWGSAWHRATLAGWQAGTAGRRLPDRGCLGKLQHYVDTRVADLDAEALLPLTYFHHLLHLEQMTTDPFRPWLAELSRERALWLGEHYGGSARPRHEARRGAAALLIAVADVLVRVGLQELEERGRDVYARALDLDRANVAALYWSAFLAERAGDYDSAVRHLRDLAAELPEDPETSLRLAVNRERTGGAREAARLLESVARGPGPEWLRILAYQELGRLRAEDPGLAAAVLREATRTLPASPSLLLQLSYLVRDDWSESSALASRVETGWESAAERSPRVLYGTARRDEVDDELAWLLVAVERRRPVLEAVLAALQERPATKRPRFAECAGVAWP